MHHDIPLKILIADDSLTYRMILKQALRGFENITLVDTAVHGQDALDKIEKLSQQASGKLPVDLVLMDIEMPVMDGLTALPKMISAFPELKVVLVSGINRNAADMTIQALQRGALDFIPKPNRDSASENLAEIKDRLQTLFDILRLRLFKQQQKAKRELCSAQKTPEKSALITPNSASPTVAKIATPPSLTLLTPPRRITALAIGSSTGGPNALTGLIPLLPGNLGVPVFIVQHMPPVFTASLAKSLNDKSALMVKEAEHGDRVEPNTVYIAPGGFHMRVSQQKNLLPTIALDQEAPENSCRPAVDPLFRSVAEIYGKHTLAVILTGMGSDGTKGLKVLKERGAYALTQDEASCVVYGMPRAAFEAGLSDEQWPLETLAQRVQALIGVGLNQPVSAR